jgi:hypothetical protein
MERQNLLKRLAYLILFIFVINFLANTFHWYFSIWYFDMPMHFLGGLLVGFLVLYLFFPRISLSPSAIVKILLLVLVVGIGWEVFEVLVDNFIAQNPFNALDTFSDLFFDLSGGAFALLYFSKKIMLGLGNEVQS